MSIFDKIKDALFSSFNNNTYSTQNNFSKYIPTYNIENWTPQIKMPKYDNLFSLQKFLEKTDIPKTTISKVMNSSNPFDEAKNLFNGLKEKVEWSDMCWRETERMERWIKVLSLWEAPSERILESTFMYILLRLGWLCHWDAQNQKAFNNDGLSYILEACENNDYSKIVKMVDGEVLSCFALAHLRSGKNLVEIVDDCFKYLDMNTTHNGSAHGSFYNLYGREQLKGIIGKIIESAYILNKFSLKTLFLKEEAFEKIDTKTLKYDISKMRKDRTVYLPSSDDQENIKNDVLLLNTYIEEANKLIGNKIGINIDVNDVVFYFGKELQDVRDFCFFIYSPNTPTGKASKYPITLNFYCKRKSEEKYEKVGNGLQFVPSDGISGNIDYLASGEIGKARIIINYQGKGFIIHLIDKKGVKVLSKIEGIKNAEKVVLYNVNKQ